MRRREFLASVTVAPLVAACDGAGRLGGGEEPTAAYARAMPAIAGEADVLFVATGKVGFGLLDVDATGERPSVRFAWVDGASGTEIFAIDIAV